MASIIIAAHNEEAVLGRTLDALAVDQGDPEVIVVPNGCTDDTAGVARERPGVTVVELSEGSKPAALNAGERVAHSFPRIYLDADIVVPPGGVPTVARALERPGVLAAVPARRLETDGRPWPVRGWAAVSRRLPVFTSGLFGRGMVAVSEAGRARFAEFPPMVADDLFLDSCFADDEKAHVEGVTVVVHAPATTRELVARLARVRRGSAAMREAGREGGLGIDVRPADRWAWLRDVVARDPRLLPAGVVYAGVTVLAALKARSGPRSSMDWGRDAVARREA